MLYIFLSKKNNPEHSIFSPPVWKAANVEKFKQKVYNNFAKLSSDFCNTQILGVTKKC